MGILEDTLLPPGGGDRSQAQYRWGVVTQLSPLRVRLDTEASAIDATPDSLARLNVNDRVFCQLYNNRLTVLGTSTRAAANIAATQEIRRVAINERTTSTANSTTTYNMCSITIPVELCKTGYRFRITAHGHVQGDTLNAYCDIQTKLGVSAAVGGTQIGGTYSHQYIAAGRQIPFSFVHEYVYGTLSESENLSPYNLVLTGLASAGNSLCVASTTRKTTLILDWIVP